MVANQNQLRARRSPHHHAAFAILCRLERVGLRYRRIRAFERTQGLLHTGQGASRIKLAGHDQHRVVAPVVAAVESLQTGNIDVFNIGLGANGGLAIAMPEVGGVVHALTERRKWIVLSHFKLVAHHRHLAVKILLRNKAVGHGVGLPAQVPVQRFLIRYEGGEIVGAVGRGRAIETQAALAELRLRIGRVRRTLENQMLQQMCHAGLAVTLMTRAHQISQVDCHAIVCHIGCQQDLESVCQTELGNAFHGLDLFHTRRQGRHFLRPDPDRKLQHQQDQHKGAPQPCCNNCQSHASLLIKYPNKAVGLRAAKNPQSSAAREYQEYCFSRWWSRQYPCGQSFAARSLPDQTRRQIFHR